MKINLWIAFLTLGVSLSSWVGLGHEPGHEKGVSTLNIKKGTLTINYRRPAARDRDLFAMIKPGSYWRLGADDPTLLTTNVALFLKNKKISKGEYTLLVHFEDQKKSSLVIATAEFGKKPGRFMPPTPEEIIATSSLSLSQLSSPVEILTIRLENQGDNVQLIVEWGQKRLTTQFQIT